MCCAGRGACSGETVLWRGMAGAQARFEIAQPGLSVLITLTDSGIEIGLGGPGNTRFHAPAGVWERFLQPLPPRHHHNLFAMRMRVPGFTVEGDELTWMQHAHLLRRILEIARWRRHGGWGSPPESFRPAGVAAPCPAGLGRYLTVGGVVLYAEQHGQGRPILCLHTAGADSRQFHRLAAEPALAGHALVAFDMPGHGRSPPIAAPGAWALDTEFYASLVLGFRDAWGFAENPVLLGASMSGEICLEIALRAPDRFAHIIACEACEHIPGRRTAWPLHPRVNAMAFTPEWVEGLMAPQSPAQCAAEVWWHYSQGGYGTFPGDIQFYSGGWDARGRLGGIDTRRCPLTLMTGEYDYSCTQVASAATAAQIPGARFIPMAMASATSPSPRTRRCSRPC